MIKFKAVNQYLFYYLPRLIITVKGRQVIQYNYKFLMTYMNVTDHGNNKESILKILASIM